MREVYPAAQCPGTRRAVTRCGRSEPPQPPARYSDSQIAGRERDPSPRASSTLFRVLISDPPAFRQVRPDMSEPPLTGPSGITSRSLACRSHKVSSGLGDLQGIDPKDRA